MSSRTTAEPMKPAPPVTRMRLAHEGHSALDVKGEAKSPDSGGSLRSLSDRIATAASIGQVDAERRIIPEEPAVAFRCVIGVDLIGDLGVGLKRAESVSEALRDEELLAPSGSQT